MGKDNCSGNRDRLNVGLRDCSFCAIRPTGNQFHSFNFSKQTIHLEKYLAAPSMKFFSVKFQNYYFPKTINRFVDHVFLIFFQKKSQNVKLLISTLEFVQWSSVFNTTHTHRLDFSLPKSSTRSLIQNYNTNLLKSCVQKVNSKNEKLVCCFCAIVNTSPTRWHFRYCVWAFGVHIILFYTLIQSYPTRGPWTNRPWTHINPWGFFRWVNFF